MIQRILLFVFGFFSLCLVGQDLEWAKKLNADESRAIATDPSGNVYSTGLFSNSGDFDPGAGITTLTSLGGSDIYISKLDVFGNLVWVKQIGGTDDDESWSLALDPVGNVYITGHFFGTIDLDPGPGIDNHTALGSLDAFVVKLDSDGNFLWAITFGGTVADAGYSMTTDAAGKIYLTGIFTGSADFDPGVGVYNLTSPSSSIFMCKFDFNGNFIWAKKIGNGWPGSEKAYAIKLDYDENILLVGKYSGTVDFDPGPGSASLTSSGSWDIFFAKFDNSGNYIYVKGIGGSGDDQAFSLVHDGSGDIYISGFFTSTVDFDPSAGTTNLTAILQDAFICKFTSSGAFIWATQQGGSNYDAVNGLAVDQMNNIYATGKFVSTVDFDPGPGVYVLDGGGTVAAFVLKLDSDGFFSWAIKIGGAGTDIGQAICTDGNGAVITTGSFANNVDFDPGPSVFNILASGTDVFIQKLICDTTYATINVIACDSYTVPSGDESYFISGTYNDTIQDFYGCVTVYTISLEVLNSTTSAISITECTFYEVPSGDEIYTSSGIYIDTIPNSIGCDSIITITLDIIPPTLDTITIIDCLAPYTVPSGDETYTLSGTYHDTIPNFTGCDSIITIHYYGVSTSNINIISCGSYTVPSGDETYFASGTYMDTLLTIGGCDSILEIDLEIKSMPDIDFVADTLNGCAAFNVGFYNLTTPSGTNCTWIFGDGGTSTWDGFSTSHNYTLVGSFDVTLISETMDGCIDSLVIPNYIQTFPYPVLVNIPDDEVCDSMIYIVPPFDAGISGVNFYWQVYLSGGPAIASGTGDSVSFPINLNSFNDEIINFYVTAVSSAGCYDTMNFEILVHPEPFISFSGNQLYGCAPLSVNFTNMSFPSGDICTWQFGDGNTANSCGSTSNIYLNPGSYDVSLKVITPFGCVDSSSYNNYITVTSGTASSSTINPIACYSYVSPGGDILTASGAYTDVISNTVGCDSIITINLTINNSTSSNQNLIYCNYLISPSGNYLWTSSGIYNDTIPNTSGCDSIMTINLTINSADNLVTQSGITLTANATGANYQWLDCNNGYAIIPGETGQSFTPTANGNYAVSIAENSCPDTSACFAINNVGLYENNESILSVYPNPSNGKFTIILKDLTQEKVDFQITNSLGQVVYSGTLSSSENQKEINLATGIYYLKINSGVRLETIELIVTE